MTRVRSPAVHSIVRSASASYRADAARRETAFGEQDSGWILVATLLEHAALVDGQTRETFFRDAARAAHGLVGPDEVTRLRKWEWENRDTSPSDAIIFLADRVLAAGAMNLAGVMLDALLVADVAMADLVRGRVMARRARVALRMDLADEAADRYRMVRVLGAQMRSDELRVRAWLGFVGLTQARGNFPQLARYARRAARLADRDGFRNLSRSAHTALAMAAAKAKRYDEAVVEGWLTYGLSVGDPAHEITALQGIGQILLESGNPEAARNAFAALVVQPLPATVMLPALGGLAVAAAGFGEEATLEWAVQEILSIHRSTAPRFSVASALIECAVALAAVGRRADAERHRESALRLTRAHDFHELTHQAETLDTSRKYSPVVREAFVSARAENVAAAVRLMSPRELPSHVRVAPECAHR